MSTVADHARIGWELNDCAFHASRLDGELARLEAHALDPSDFLAIQSVRTWARQIVSLVHEPLD